MIDWFTQFSKDTFMFNSLLGFFLYWVPMFFCLVGYTIKTARNFKKDKEKRKKCEAQDLTQKPHMIKHYYPTDTLGELIGRGLVSIIPIANFLAAMFDVSPEFFRSIFKWIGGVFDQPLVPKRKSD